MTPKMTDCRKIPNEIGCTLTAVAHAVARHGH